MSGHAGVYSKTFFGGAGAMGHNERIIRQFRTLTAQADALPVPEADREAIALDLILKLKEKSKREARRYARQGCYRNGNAPKKSVVQNYEKTREYRRRYTDALERDVIYQEILDDSIRKNYEFREQLDMQVARTERENRKQVRRELAKKLRKLSRAYIHSLDIDAFMNE